MMHNHHGIVLRAPWEADSSVIIFDRDLGKVSCKILRKRGKKTVINGGIYSYAVTTWRSFRCIADFELLQQPALWVADDLLFFHHVLEVCFYFLSFDQECSDVFDLVMNLYAELPEGQCVATAKKIFLCRFFALIGMYPESHKVSDEIITCLISPAGDIMLDSQKASFINKQAVAWLHTCINQHPQAHSFKTRHFLYTVKNDE